jgi:hypothetical protein
MSVVVTLHATMRCNAYLIRYLPSTFKLSKTSISEGFWDYTPETVHHVLRQGNLQSIPSCELFLGGGCTINAPAAQFTIGILSLHLKLVALRLVPTACFIQGDLQC